MNGNHLDIQASVDLAGLKQLKEMLTKFEGILEMMTPGTKEAANCGGLAGLTKAVRLAVQSGRRRLLYKDGGLKPCFCHSQKVTAISIGLSSLSPRQALVRVLAVFMCRHDVFPCSAPIFSTLKMQRRVPSSTAKT
jgi:hypothetical protein